MFPKLRELQTDTLGGGAGRKEAQILGLQTRHQGYFWGQSPSNGTFFLSRRPKGKKKNLTGNVNEETEETVLGEESQL